MKNLIELGFSPDVYEDVSPLGRVALGVQARFDDYADRLEQTLPEDMSRVDRAANFLITHLRSPQAG